MIKLKKKNKEAYAVSKGTLALREEFKSFEGSQSDFASFIGTSRQNIGRWLKGREPNMHSKRLLENLFVINPYLWWEY